MSVLNTALAFSGPRFVYSSCIRKEKKQIEIVVVRVNLRDTERKFDTVKKD